MPSDFAASVAFGGKTIRAVSVSLLTPFVGAWVADVDLDPDSSPVTVADVPTGSVTVTIQQAGGSPITLAGTVDPNARGRFVSSAKVRVVAGANGWDQDVPRQDFQSSGGVSSLTVEQATASVVGETVNDPAPVSLGLHWMRSAGPASRIFGDRSWFVDVAGVTQIGVRPSVTIDSSADLLEWDPLHQRGVFSVDGLVIPGTTFTDPRLDGPVTIRDTEQHWSKDGTRVTVWCSAQAVTRLVSALRNMVRELGVLSPLKVYEYRIVAQPGPATLELQAVDPDAGMPDTMSIPVWPGMAGLSATYTLSTNVLVMFVAGDPGQPVVVGFAGDQDSIPQDVTVDATNTVNVGPSASMVKIAGGGKPMARQGDIVTVILPTFSCVGVATSPTLNPTPPYAVPVVFTAMPSSPAMGQITTGDPRAQGSSS